MMTSLQSHSLFFCFEVLDGLQSDDPAAASCCELLGQETLKIFGEQIRLEDIYQQVFFLIE